MDAGLYGDAAADFEFSKLPAFLSYQLLNRNRLSGMFLSFYFPNNSLVQTQDH